MTLTHEIIGERLREARKNIGLNQEAAAAAIGMERTVLVKIEKGTRMVTGVELHQLAQLYRRDPSEFLTEQPLQEDPLTTLGRIDGNENLKWTKKISRSVEMLKEAVWLSEALGDRIQVAPPLYQFPAPTSYEEAVEQGKEIAISERDRLKLGSAPILDVASLIASQGIWAAAVPFPDEVSGLFIAHKKYGLAIFVNDDHKRVRRRFSYAHEYAHALVDRDRKDPEPTSAKNNGDLIEKRANAFASELLLPATAIHEALERMHKGLPSRASSYLWDAATDRPEPLEVRRNSLAQKISVSDVALLAHEYMVSYDVAAIRFKDINAINKTQLDSLLAQREQGRQLLRALKFSEQESGEKEEQPYLIRQLVILGIEAFRRKKITSGRFREVCELAGIPYEELMPVAMAEVEE